MTTKKTPAFIPAAEPADPPAIEAVPYGGRLNAAVLAD
jgi:hypothetical protein